MKKKTRASLTERNGIGLKQNQTSSQRKLTPTNPRVMRKNISVNMVKKQQGTEGQGKGSEEPTIPVKESDLETPYQSIDGAERKMTESTPMPNVEEQGKKKMEFSPIGNVDETTNNTPETIKDDSQTKRTSFTEKFAAMVGMKPKEKEEVIVSTEKSKMFGTVSDITKETKQDKEQVTQKATANQNKRTMESKRPSLELADLMANLERIDKKLKCSEEDRQELKKEARHNKNENLDNNYFLAGATEEKLQQMADKVETTDKEREKHIKKDMEEMKKTYDTVNEKLWNLRTRLDTMSKEPAESSAAIQSKLDSLLRNSTAQDKLADDKPLGTRVDFEEPHRKKREYTPLPRIDCSTG